MAVNVPRFHEPVYGGAEGLRHHLCVHHGEHRDEGTSQQELEDLHEDEHDIRPHHTGEYSCPEWEHSDMDEPDEWDELHEDIGEIHRGIGVDLPDELHKFVHDRRRRPADRAQALLDHVRSHREGIGVHWTTEPGVAEDFGETNAKSYATGKKPGTSVVFHAAPPEREHIDTSIYADPTVYRHNDHGEREVPLRSGEDADLTGISWAPVHDDWDAPHDREYTRHEFAGELHTAAQQDQAAELLGHFEAAGLSRPLYAEEAYGPWLEQHGGLEGDALADHLRDEHRWMRTDIRTIDRVQGRLKDTHQYVHRVNRYSRSPLHRSGDDVPEEFDSSWESGPDSTRTPEITAAARPGRGEKVCPCCSGSGEHGGRCDACGGTGFVGRDDQVEHCPGQPQPKRRRWRQGSMPQPDYDPAAELPQGRGVWYRLHGKDQPLDEAHARSRPDPDMGIWSAKPTVDDRVGKRGYSAFASPHTLSQYMDEFGWISNGITRGDDRHVIAFHGRMVGRGDDNEPLVIPEASPHCCGRVIHSSMPFGEFEDRIWGENAPESVPAKPWDAKYKYEGSPVDKSVKRHYRQETRRYLRDQRREAAMDDMIDLYHHTYPESAEAVRREKRFLSDDDEDRVYFTNAPMSASARDYGDEDGNVGIVHVRMPRHLVHEWSGGVNSEGEAYYDAAREDIRPEHILGDDPVIRREAATVPPAERHESVRHMLDNYRPYDFGTWDEVRDNINWDHPSMRDFVEDVRRNGVQRPIPVDYEQDPPQVRNGHTRLLAAERAGRETVPARQHEGFMDPDDPDPLGRGPDDPEHWTNQPEWQHEAALEVPAPAGAGPSDDYKDPRAAELLGHFEGAPVKPETIDLYHRTDPHLLDLIQEHGLQSANGGGRGPVWFSDTPYSPDTDQHDEGMIHVRVPRKITQLDEVRPSGERHYRINEDQLRPEHYVSFYRRRQDFPNPVRQVEAAAEDPDVSYRMQHQGPDADDGEAMHEIGSGRTWPADFHDRPWEYRLDAHEESMDNVLRSRGRPSRKVWVYRALPSPHREVNPGDWVSTSGAYARSEGRTTTNRDDDYPVVKFQARADQLRNEGNSLNEWSYHGPRVNRAQIHYSGGANHRGKSGRGKTDSYASEHEPEDMHRDYEAQSAEYRRRRREERQALEQQARGENGPDLREAAMAEDGGLGHREAALPNPGSTGETAPEGHDIWAEPHGVSPVAEELKHNMMTREPGDEHGSNWYHGLPYHGPYHLIRHPQTRETWLVDRQGRNAEPHGHNFGNWQRDGMYRETVAQEHWHGLETTGPDAHRIGTWEDPKYTDVMKERTPEFPHSRIDPEDLERVNRPVPRVHAPEGHSPEDEYHGSYEVVRHPETGKFHVVDNAGRHAPGSAIAWNGFDTQLKAERSRDYTEGRQQSKERAKGIADKLWGEETEEEREGRESERNLQDAQDLMSRYEGGKGQIKFDEDEEGGRPYYEREHHLENGQPSGWYVKHYNGTSADVYHRATGDRGHDLLRLTSHEMPDGSEHLSPAYGDEDLARDLKEWHDRPDGMRRYYEEDKYGRQNEPRIIRWKRRHLGSLEKDAAAELIAHFEEGEDGPKGIEATAAEVPQYGPKPEFKAAPEDWPDDKRMEHWERQREIRDTWNRHIQHGLSVGHLSSEQAEGLGWRPSGHATLSGSGGSAWQRLPQEMYHVTTDLPGVAAHGLKTRDELGQNRGGHGLGGGEDDTISLTTDRALAGHILRGLHEFHDVVNHRLTPRQMWDQAKRGEGAPRPFHEDLASYWERGWKEGDPVPRGLDAKLRGLELKSGGLLYTPQEMAEHEGPGWRPHPEADVLRGGDGKNRYNIWERDLDPDRKREQAADFYKNFSAYRGYAGGRPNPMFFSTDTKAFAAKDPRHFAILHVRPRPGAQGYPPGGMSEWRTGTGDALEVHRAERLEDGHVREASAAPYRIIDERPEFHVNCPQGARTVWLSEGDEPRCTGCGHRVQDPDTGHIPEQTRNMGLRQMIREMPDRQRAKSYGISAEAERLASLEVTAVEGETPYQPDPQDHELEAHMRAFHSYPGYLSFGPVAEERKEHNWRHDPEVGPAPFGPWNHQHVLPKGDTSDRWKPFAMGDGFSEAGGGAYRGPARALEHALGEEAEENEEFRPPPDPDMRRLSSAEDDGIPDVVAHFEEPKTAAGPYYQQKLFDMKHQPGLNAPGSGRHNPEDPLAHSRWRQEHEEGYVPPRESWDDPERGNVDDETGLYRHPEHGGYHCHACQDFHEDPQAVEDHMGTYTDWDEEYPRLPEHMSRGYSVKLPPGLHALVHDESRPDAERGAALLDHLSHGGYGMHWTPSESQANHYAELSVHDHGGGTWSDPDRNHTMVILHARKPAREHIETDPDILHEHLVLGHDTHEDAEIPMKEDAPVHVTGVSWRLPGNGGDYTRHDLPEPAEHTATAAGMPEVVAHFAEPEEHTAAREENRHQLADIGQSMLDFDQGMSREDRQFFQDAINHIRSGAPASKPINAEDAARMARGARTRDKMEESGWQLSPGSEKDRYPRGFTIEVGDGHRATLSPNNPSGWHVRTYLGNHPMDAQHIHHDLEVNDSDLPHELRRYYGSEQIRGELAAQRAEAVANGSGEEHTAALDAPQYHPEASCPSCRGRNWERAQLPEDLPDDIRRSLPAPASCRNCGEIFDASRSGREREEEREREHREWEEATANRKWNGEPLFHGTRSELHPGELITPEEAERHPAHPDEESRGYVHATPVGEEAAGWAERANPHETHKRMLEMGRERSFGPGGNQADAYRPRVYQVEPAGEMESDPNGEGSSFRTAQPMRVIREVHRLQCYHPDHEGEMHWPDHPHYETLARDNEDESMSHHLGSSGGDRYVTCDRGHEHWGAYGAAGLLIRHKGDDGQYRYLLQHRSPYVQHGDTWSTPGGAIGRGESPEAGARREAEEEFGELPEGITHHHTYTDDHGGWKYHTVVMDSPHRFAPSGGDEDSGWESEGHGWFTPEEMKSLDLHPGFAGSWDKVRKSGALEGEQRREAMLRYTPHVREVLPLHMMSHHGWSQEEVREALAWPEEANALPRHHDAEHAQYHTAIEHLRIPHAHEDVSYDPDASEWRPPEVSNEDRGWLGGHGVEASLGDRHEDMDEAQMRQHMRDRHGFTDSPDDPDWVIEEQHRGEHADAPLEHSHPDLESDPEWDEEVGENLGDKDFLHQHGIEAALEHDAARELVAHFGDDDEDYDDEPQEEPYERVSPERDEDDFVWQRRRGLDSGVTERVPDEPPKCLNCSSHEGAEVHHYPEEGHAPEVESRLAAGREREARWERGEYDRTRYCGVNCEMGHAEDRAHGIGVHHTFPVGHPELADMSDEEMRRYVSGGVMPQLSGPYEEPVGRDSRYEVRNPSAEHRCHYCRSILPQYRHEAALESRQAVSEDVIRPRRPAMGNAQLESYRLGHGNLTWQHGENSSIGRCDDCGATAVVGQPTGEERRAAGFPQEISENSLIYNMPGHASRYGDDTHPVVANHLFDPVGHLEHDHGHDTREGIRADLEQSRREGAEIDNRERLRWNALHPDQADHEEARPRPVTDEDVFWEAHTRHNDHHRMVMMPHHTNYHSHYQQSPGPVKPAQVAEYYKGMGIDPRQLFGGHAGGEQHEGSRHAAETPAPTEHTAAVEPVVAHFGEDFPFEDPEHQDPRVHPLETDEDDEDEGHTAALQPGPDFGSAVASRNHWDMTENGMRLHLKDEHEIANPGEDPASVHWDEHSGDTQRHVHPDLEQEFVRAANPSIPQGDAFIHTPDDGPIDPVFGAVRRVECSECGGQVQDGRCRGCGQEMAVPRWMQNRPVQRAYPVVRGIEQADVDPGRSAEDDEFLSEHGIEAALRPVPGDDPGDVPSFTWRYETQTSTGYEPREEVVRGPFYHGGRSKGLSAGDELRKGFKTNDWGDEGPRSKFIHFTTELAGAADYARRAGGHVYEVEPTGDDIKGGYTGGEFKSKKPLRVRRVVPPEEIARNAPGQARLGASPAAPKVLYSCATDQAVPAVTAKVPPLKAIASSASGIGSWQPESPGEAAELLASVPDVIKVIGDGLHRLAARMDGLPVHADIPAMLRQMAAGCLAAHEDIARLLSSPEGTWSEPGPKG